jgi:hypothetical protein
MKTRVAFTPDPSRDEPRFGLSAALAALFLIRVPLIAKAMNKQTL